MTTDKSWRKLSESMMVPLPDERKRMISIMLDKTRLVPFTPDKSRHIVMNDNKYLIMM